eukprot:TRINITY_DN1908_c0_g2_i1.p1 TRINITY_DN1908_c0_g2~~TRINITY_DN1908_c0_g2_i1.p1  ORF type:complete len:308 (-),score=59.16 TRINITY_DN1908_c0_g2_i1:139-942(-)
MSSLFSSCKNKDIRCTVEACSHQGFDNCCVATTDLVVGERSFSFSGVPCESAAEARRSAFEAALSDPYFLKLCRREKKKEKTGTFPVGIESEQKFKVVSRLLGAGAIRNINGIESQTGVRVRLVGEGTENRQGYDGPLSIEVNAETEKAFDMGANLVRKLLAQVRSEFAAFRGQDSKENTGSNAGDKKKPPSGVVEMNHPNGKVELMKVDVLKTKPGDKVKAKEVKGPRRSRRRKAKGAKLEAKRHEQQKDVKVEFSKGDTISIQGY